MLWTTGERRKCHQTPQQTHSNFANFQFPRNSVSSKSNLKFGKSLEVNNNTHKQILVYSEISGRFSEEDSAAGNCAVGCVKWCCGVDAPLHSHHQFEPSSVSPCFLSVSQWVPVWIITTFSLDVYESSVTWFCSCFCCDSSVSSQHHGIP